MRFNIKNKKYKTQLRKEAEIWGNAALRESKQFSPDYSSYKNTLPYKIYRNIFIRKTLAHIKPGQKVLDLGCYNGWFTLEIARRGADVDAHDVAKKAIAIGNAYYKKIKKKEKIPGNITYHVTDLNKAHFPKNTYDIVIFRNILHHIGNVDELILEVARSLKPGGILIADDGLACGKMEALVVGGFLMLMPTDIPYTSKVQRVFKKGKILQRTQGLADSKDGSPFEGITGSESVSIIRKYFNVTYYTTFAAFTGVLTSQIQLSQTIKVPFLKFVNVLDKALIESNILKGSAYYLEGQKKS